MSNKLKKKTAMDRETEMQGARMLGKHVSEEKGRILLAVTMLACATPVILGIRLWDQIPQVVQTGLIGANGQDDSLPRWAVAFLLPGLMCLLNFLAHYQLRVNQKRMTIPPTHVRFVGRWGFPIISVLFCSGMIFQSTGGQALPLVFVTPCVLGLALMMLGAHMYACPEDSRIALRFSFMEHNAPLRSEVHRFAGWVWMAVGLVAIICVMVNPGSSVVASAIILAALAAPWLYGRSRSAKLG